MDDVPKVVALSKTWSNEEITYGLAPNSVDYLKRMVGNYFWVAEIECEIVGYIFGTVHISDGSAVIPQGERYIEIDEVYVLPDHRSSGVGSQLVRHLLSEAESQGIKRSVVYSASKQWEKIVGFYEKHGFQMWFVQMYRNGQ